MLLAIFYDRPLLAKWVQLAVHIFSYPMSDTGHWQRHSDLYLIYGGCLIPSFPQFFQVLNAASIAERN